MWLERVGFDFVKAAKTGNTARSPRSGAPEPPARFTV